MKEKNYQKWIFNFVFLTMIFSVIFLIYRITVAPETTTDKTVMIKSDYSLMFSQSVLGIIAMLLPSIVSRKLRIEIPSNMMLLYVIFLYCAIFLGEVRSYYYDVPHWDTILHGFSGAMLGAVGFSFVSLLNNSDNIPMNLSPSFVAMFAFCFALMLGVFWEVYEYSFDGLWGLNMQKFMTEDGVEFVGRLALHDTMKDLIVDAIGAFTLSLFGYFSLKYKTKFVEGFLIKKIKFKEKRADRYETL